ncbi:MAG: M48 family metalloprotease [Planctomycetota bacterium]
MIKLEDLEVDFISKFCKWWLYFVGFVVVLGGCGVNPVSGKTEFQIISDSEEVILGESTRKQAEIEFGGIFENKEIEEYVNYVGQKLARVSHRPNFKYTFKVVNSKILNAFAIPGGYIYITKGLLAKLEKESQLAAVLGHEVAHIGARHSARMLENALLAEGIILGGYAILRKKTGDKNVRNIYKIASHVTAAIILSGYSRENEEQADILGLDYIVKNNYHPYGMVELLEILQKEGKERPNLVQDLFRTHPYTKKRIEYVKREIDERYKERIEKGGLIIDTDEFQRIVRSYFKNIKF